MTGPKQPEGARPEVRKDRFQSSTLDGITFEDGDTDPDDITDEDLEDLFGEDLLDDAGIQRQPAS